MVLKDFKPGTKFKMYGQVYQCRKGGYAVPISNPENVPTPYVFDYVSPTEINPNHCRLVFSRHKLFDFLILMTRWLPFFQTK